MEDVKTNSVTERGRLGFIRGRERDYDSNVLGRTNFLDLPYAELEEKNLRLKEERLAGVSSDEMEGKLIEYLRSEPGIKAVMVCFSDLHGRFHALDYDKKFLVDSPDNITFDGSSIRGFTELSQSDLRLKLDWTSFRWLPADLFGAGKVMIFGNVCNGDDKFFESDFRARLSVLSDVLRKEKGMLINIAPEIEGFLFKGENAEQNYSERQGFELATMSGYFHSLPQDTLRRFIDKFAEAQRALGFQNEKDHPEVAPAQFELTFKYSLALDSADQIQIYKLLARQIAKSFGFTASFLPKPIANLNGSGMHVNISVSQNGENLFYGEGKQDSLSDVGRRFITGILFRAKELCLVMNSSVNSYRRLDPNFEAPNKIKVCSLDRGSMVRIPLGNKKSSRIEVRTIAPDVNPYLCIYSLMKAGIAAMEFEESELKNIEAELYGKKPEILPVDIYEAMDCFSASDFMKDILGEKSHKKYWELKNEMADRSPRNLGHKVKSGEILYHHDVTNQLIWDNF
jgi:glutamine synthetase